MDTYLGVGPYEKDWPTRPSIHRAKSIFLRLLDGFTFRPDSETTFKNLVPTSLHDDVFLHFTVLVVERFSNALFLETPLTSFASDAALFLHVKRTLAPQEVENFLPDHLALKRESPPTYDELIKWAKRWNINRDWCLEFAVKAMRMWLFHMYAREMRLWGPAIKSDSNDFMWDAVAEHITEESFNGGFSFECENVSFKASGWNYLLEEPTEWRGRITGNFLAQLKSAMDRGENFPHGVLSKVISRFEKEIENHVRQSKAAIRKRGYKPTPRLKSHAPFAWTICYQVLKLNLSDICREVKQPKRTVADGVDRTIALLGLKKRPPRRGRKPGIVGGRRELSIREEAEKRLRLGRFISALSKVHSPEKKAHVARAIGISASHFSRVWIPYLLKETRSKDYFALIRKHQPEIP